MIAGSDFLRAAEKYCKEAGIPLSQATGKFVAVMYNHFQDQTSSSRSAIAAGSPWREAICRKSI